MGTAFLAVADDPSAILHNPGGIALIDGTQAYVGITALTIDTSFKDGSGNIEKTEQNIYLVPHIFLTHRLESSKITIGFGLYSPFGIGGREWPSNGLTRYLATEGGISTIAMNPTIAFKANPKLSLAVGLDYLQAMSINEMMLDQSAFSSSDGKFRIEGEGAGWGWNLGSLWRVTPAFRIGLAYRSGISVDFDQVHTDFEVEVPAGGIVDRTAFPNWEDSLQVKLGLEHELSDRTSLRAGYAYIPTFVPDESLEAGNPDSDQQSFSFGYGYRKDKIQIDTFVMLSLFKNRVVSNTFQTGKFENQVVYLGVSTGYRF